MLLPNFTLEIVTFFVKKCLCNVGLRLLHYFPAEALTVFEPKRTTNLRPN